jgi:site-specific DNA-methyltransferase (adenine-specific)
VTPFYDEGGITIYCGDCRDILPGLGTFDLLLTDPPFGLNIDTRNAKRNRGYRTGMQGGACRAVDMPRVIGDDSPFDPRPLLGAARALVLWGANHYSSRLPDTPFWLTWDRKAGRGARSTVTDCELAAVYGHRFRTVRLFRHMWAGFQRDSEVGARALHPTQKPVALMAWCLSFFPEARTVVDPYMGSGPVAKACADAGIRYVGIELVEAYCERAVARLAQRALPQLARAAPIP